MGTFGGHALPGSFFIVFALWWMIQIFRRYYKSLGKDGKRYRSSLTFHCCCLCSKLRTWEVEGFILILFVFIGGAIEIYTGFLDGHFVYLGNGQHATMFFFFGMYGVIRILQHYRLPLPKGVDYIALALALSVEALLFLFHVHLKEGLEVVLHTLLVYAVVASVAAVLLEMVYPDNVMAALARAYCTMLQGTWFWHIGFILFNPIPGAALWDMESDDSVLLATMFFAWHMAAAFIVTLVVGAVIGCISRRQGHFSAHDYDSLSMNLITTNSNGHTIVNVHDDSDSDIEFEKPVSRAR